MNLKSIFKNLGPGLLYAGAAIGVSHLVQSTRAGAIYGWLPIIGILLIHIAKYPFFKMGPVYASETGTNLIDGYRKLGKWAILLFGFFTIGTMFTVIAAIVSVTAGILGYIFELDWSPSMVSGLVMIAAAFLLVVGKYQMLDKLINLIIVTLSLATLTAFIVSLSKVSNVSFPIEEMFEGAFLVLLIKLMGWMPAPLDLSVWHSIWVIEKEKDSGGTYNKVKSKLDFELGYWGTMIIGILFLGLGSFVLYPSDTLPSSGVQFASIFIGVYTTSIGPWAVGIIGFAALMTMFSTVLTCMDAIPRTLSEIFKGSFTGIKNHYLFYLTILSLGSFSLLHFWAPGMLKMVDLATVLSFCSAPIIAFLNLKCFSNLQTTNGNSFLPKSGFQFWYATISLIILTVLAVLYLIYRFYLSV